MRRTIALCALMSGFAMIGCAGSEQEINDEDPVMAGKADRTAKPLLVCTQKKARREANLEGALNIYDRGLADEVPENLPTSIEFLVHDGFPIQKYQLTASFSVNGGACRRVNQAYYGNLYQGGGNIVSLYKTAYEMSIDRDGYFLIVRIDEGTDVGIELDCNGQLPTEEKALGANRMGSR